MRPPRHRHDGAPVTRAVDDDGTVPYEVALAAQDVLDGLLGDDYFELGDFVHQLTVLARHTCDGHHPERAVWTGGRIASRVAELAAEWNPPLELGGDHPDRVAVSA